MFGEVCCHHLQLSWERCILYKKGECGSERIKGVTNQSKEAEEDVGSHRWTNGNCNPCKGNNPQTQGLEGKPQQGRRPRKSQVQSGP